MVKKLKWRNKSGLMASLADKTPLPKPDIDMGQASETAQALHAPVLEQSPPETTIVRPPLVRTTTRLTIELDARLHKKLKVMSVHQEISLRELVTRILEKVEE